MLESLEPEQILQWQRECLEHLVTEHMTEPPNPDETVDTAEEYTSKKSRRASWDIMQTHLHSLRAGLKDGVWPKEYPIASDLPGAPNLPSRIHTAAVMAAGIYRGKRDMSSVAPVIQGLTIFGPISKDDNLETFKEEMEWQLTKLKEIADD